jgi:hypothetical protein
MAQTESAPEHESAEHLSFANFCTRTYLRDPEGIDSDGGKRAVRMLRSAVPKLDLWKVRLGKYADCFT